MVSASSYIINATGGIVVDSISALIGTQNTILIDSIAFVLDCPCIENTTIAKRIVTGTSRI